MDDRRGAGSGAVRAGEGGVSVHIPIFALSVRQPWAWAIVHAGKDVENRSRFAVTKGNLDRKGRVAIHASVGMTRDEYESASDFMASLGITCPRPDQLVRGGLIGAVTISDLVRKSDSPWFFGPCGLVLSDPEVLDPVPCKGALGLFPWTRPAAYDDRLAEALPWMVSWPDKVIAKRKIAAVQEALL